MKLFLEISLSGLIFEKKKFSCALFVLKTMTRISAKLLSFVATGIITHQLYIYDNSIRIDLQSKII